MKNKVTIDKLAKDLGCSKTTVSRALSGKGRISEERRKEILEYSRKCGYRPNMIAKSLADSKTYNIGVVLPADQDLNEIPFFQNCLLGICEAAEEDEYDVLVTTVDMDNIARLKNMVEKRKVDGIILTRALVEDMAIEYLLECGIPFVVVGSSPNPGVTQIDNNHVEACRELTSLLIINQLRRIGFIGGNRTHVVSQKRYKGFCDGLEMHQIPLKQKLVFMGCNTKSAVNQATEILLERQVDCILCMDDKICSQVLVKLAKEKVSIPGDVKVAAFYDSLFLQSHKPEITTLRFDEKELGRVSCQMLLKKMEGCEVPNKTCLGYDIVIRPSTQHIM